MKTRPSFVVAKDREGPGYTVMLTGLHTAECAEIIAYQLNSDVVVVCSDMCKEKP